MSAISAFSSEEATGILDVRFVRSWRAVMASILTRQPGKEAVCCSEQLGHFRGVVSQQAGTGLSFPPFTQPWLPHRWASLVCAPAQIGQVGSSCLLSWEGWPNLAQWRHWVNGEEENIFSHLRGREKSRIESVRSVAWSGVTETTTEVVGFCLSAGFGFRYLASVMMAPFAKPMGTFIIWPSSTGSSGRTCTGTL